ncbi:hypothetical protein BVRB_4g094280 [Beta vulgaris subsp. vulgaris]|nr:hypothetical protein BVRB_4g094280 [Beta vulgaris subsp. vulgaris]
MLPFSFTLLHLLFLSVSLLHHSPSFTLSPLSLPEIHGKATT